MLCSSSSIYSAESTSEGFLLLKGIFILLAASTMLEGITCLPHVYSPYNAHVQGMHTMREYTPAICTNAIVMLIFIFKVYYLYRKYRLWALALETLQLLFYTPVKLCKVLYCTLVYKEKKKKKKGPISLKSVSVP